MAGEHLPVRRAVELLVGAFSQASRTALAHGDPDPLPADGQVVYDAAVTVMLRVAFLQAAAQCDLLPGDLVQCDLVSAGTRGDIWRRLMVAGSALHAGPGTHGDHAVASDGSLFDPDRFPFLTATTSRGAPVLTVTDRVMRHILQTCAAHAPAPPDSPEVCAEQLGYLYEALAGYTTCATTETVIRLIGAAGHEPEMPVSVLEDLARTHPEPARLAAAVYAWCKEHQTDSRPARIGPLSKRLACPPEDADGVACTPMCDLDEGGRVRPYLGIAGRDVANQATVYPPGTRRVRPTGRRGEAGGHYTQHVLARDVVRKALDRAFADPGLAPDPSSVRVADIACGGGAFLLAATSYLADRLAQQRQARHPCLDPTQATRAAMRDVLGQCIHGADLDPIAVQVCKASLWLVAMDKTLPLSFLDANIRHGDALIGQTQASVAPANPAEEASPYPLHWPLAFGEVMARGGFDVIVGNPPWLAHAGRAARPLSQGQRAYYRARYAAFAGYRTTHALFMEQAQRLLRSGGVCALVVPTSVADLDGYAPARRAVTALANPVEPMPSYGDGRFSGVFQPCMALITTRRSNPRTGQERPWSLESDFGPEVAATLGLLVDRAVLPAHLFGDVGLQSTPQIRADLASMAPGRRALLEGKDIGEFHCAQPRLGIPPQLVGARGVRQQEAEVVLRQTARYPIAAINAGWNFRNSLLGVFPDASWDRDLLLGLLNSGVLRWFHYHRFRDAREGMPQVKIGHLRRYPAPRRGAGLDEIRRLVRNWGAGAERDALDAAVAHAYGLPAQARRIIAAWQPPR